MFKSPSRLGLRQGAGADSRGAREKVRAGGPDDSPTAQSRPCSPGLARTSKPIKRRGSEPAKQAPSCAPRINCAHPSWVQSRFIISPRSPRPLPAAFWVVGGTACEIRVTPMPPRSAPRSTRHVHPPRPSWLQCVRALRCVPTARPPRPLRPNAFLDSPQGALTLVPPLRPFPHPLSSRPLRDGSSGLLAVSVPTLHTQPPRRAPGPATSSPFPAAHPDAGSPGLPARRPRAPPSASADVRKPGPEATHDPARARKQPASGRAEPASP